MKAHLLSSLLMLNTYHTIWQTTLSLRLSITITRTTYFFLHVFLFLVLQALHLEINLDHNSYLIGLPVIKHFLKFFFRDVKSMIVFNRTNNHSTNCES